MERTQKPQELSALHRIAAIAPRSVDEELVIHEVLTAADEVVSGEAVLMFSYDSDSDQMWLHSSARGEGLKLSMAEPSVVRRIFDTGRGEVVNELVMDSEPSPLLSEKLGAHQIVAVPLSSGGKKLGVLAAINSTRGGFVQDDLMRLSVVADQAAFAIENAQLRVTLQRQRQEIDGLHRLSRLLASSEGTDRVVGESVRIAADLLECDQVVLMLYEDESDSLIAHPRGVGVSSDQLELLKVSLSRPSLSGTVFRTDSPLISNEADSDAWVDAGLRETLRIETVMVVPLMTTVEPIGVMVMANAKKGHFDEDDARFAGLLGGRIGGVVESSRARERERALVQKLKEIDHTKSEFVSMLAHELKGPMTTLIGFSHVLKEQWDAVSDEKRRNILEILSKEMDRLARLVSDLLDLSRIEAGTLRYEMQAVDLGDLIDNTLEIHSSLSRHHAFVCEIPDNLSKVWADPDRLRQVLINLMTNATRYSPHRTSVSVTAAQKDREVVVSITDEGIGIAPEDSERVFEKFSAIEKPSWVQKGTGLGLYITKGIVEAHGGTLGVESEPGKGATFVFTLRPAGDTA
ncbi:MAG: ATP-binding protein [Actinomycetota bacterium]